MRCMQSGATESSCSGFTETENEESVSSLLVNEDSLREKPEESACWSAANAKIHTSTTSDVDLNPENERVRRKHGCMAFL